MFKRVSGILNDVQVLRNDGGRAETCLDRFSVLIRIDYEFVSAASEVINAKVPNSRFIRRAPDHLPLVVKLSLPGANRRLAS